MSGNGEHEATRSRRTHEEDEEFLLRVFVAPYARLCSCQFAVISPARKEGMAARALRRSSAGNGYRRRRRWRGGRTRATTAASAAAQTDRSPCCRRAPCARERRRESPLPAR